MADYGFSSEKQQKLAEKEVGAEAIKSFDDQRGNIVEFDDGTEWLIFDSYEEAEQACVDYVREMLEDEPETFTQSWLEQWIDEDHLRDELYSDVRDMNFECVKESPESYDLTEKDAEKENDDFDSKVDELTDEQLEDPIQYLKDIYGNVEGITEAIKIGGIDYDAAAQDAVDTDGVAHFFAGYDGNQVELDDETVMYRTN